MLFDLLVETATAEGIPFTVQGAAKYTGTDADAIFTARGGVATALVSVPLRYMHSPNELAALSDIEHAAELLAATARRLEHGTDLIPR